MTNNYTLTELTLRRIDICDLLLACLCAERSANDGGKKWRKLHDEIKEQLKEFDRNGGAEALKQ